MTRIKYLLFLSFLICQYSFLTAQYDNISFDRVSAKYGLPNGYIKDIMEDHFGFLWFGTREGLFRYDGYEFKAYRHDISDSTTLSNPNINEVCESSSGEIWVGTNNGLNLLDRRTGKSQRFLPSPQNETTSKINNLIRKVFEDSRGNLWLASVSKNNMLRFDRSSKQFISTHEMGDPNSEHFVRNYFEDRNANVWAGTSSGLLKLNPGDSTFHHLLLDPDPSSDNNNISTGICDGTDGSFWLATKAGLVNWHPETKIIRKGFLPMELDGVQINYLTLDRNNNLWLALNNNGLGVYDIIKQRFNHFIYQANQSKSLNNNSVTFILEDRFQNIWVGTENGISKIRLDNSSFELFLNEGGDGNISNNITRVMRDSKGVIWTKTPEGIFAIEKGKTQGKKIEELSHYSQGLGWDWFLEDYEGGIWFSVSGDGIYRRAASSSVFQKMPLGDTLSNEGIFKMIIDNKDPAVFWIGTTLGLCRLNWKTLERRWYQPMNDIPEISSNRFTIFEQFGEGEIWLYYTYSNSLGRFDKNIGKFELFLPDPDNKSVLEGDIKDIAIGKDGNLWIASLYGLTNFNIHTKKFGIFGKKQGMLENELQSVLIDKNDQVWVTGNRFFARFDQTNNTFENYLISKEILHFQSKSKHVAEDGSILFGSINGVYTFHPDQIHKNQKVPNVILTDFKVKTESYLLGQAFEDTKNIILSHHENDIAFEFSGLHYINPEANEYKCKLQGYDKDWRELGNEHKVSYTNLNPAQYIFHVIAANSDGVWNQEGLTIQLTITPAFWQTLWFESLIALVILSIGYALFKNRQHQLALKRQKEMAEQSAEYKTRFLADVSHEIRTPMNAIIGLSKLALDSELDKKQSKFIGAIQQSSQNLLTIINDLLDHTKLESGKFAFVNKPFKLNNITDQLIDTLKHKGEEKKLAFEIITDPNIPQEITGDPLRLTQILTNLLGNALKFTEQGKIWLNVEKTQDSDQHVKLKFEVGDTGIGIAKDQLDYIFESFNQADTEKSYEIEGTGLGLSIARQLVERQGGQLFIESELGTGTKLWFELEFGKTILEQDIQELKEEHFTINKLKILVVEDNYFNQMVVIEILEKYIDKTKIVIAENGKLALEKLAEQPFDIIVMDVKMPVMDGYEATIAIRNSGNKQIEKTPILAVTANALPEQLQKCKEVGMDDYVTKPIDENELLKKIYTLTNNHQLIDRKKLKHLLANDEKRVQRYLDIFKLQTPEQLKQIKDSLIDNNLEQVSITAHNIKSQCRFLGLDEMAGLAFEIEQLAENGNKKDSLSDLTLQLEEKINTVIQNELT